LFFWDAQSGQRVNAALHSLERREQEHLLLKAFLQLDEESLDPALLEEFRRVRLLAAFTNRRLLRELAHPPERADRQPWLLALPLTDGELQPLLEALRDSLCAGRSGAGELLVATGGGEGDGPAQGRAVGPAG
jgi:hypothetical protein